MKITFDKLTEERLLNHLGDRPGYLKLFYDVEDCGCNGMVVIRIVDEPYRTDIHVEAAPFAFLIDLQQESLFDQEMRLTAEPNYPSFKLSSDSSVFSSNLRVKDLRGA